MPKIRNIEVFKYSSEYGNKKVYGQPLNVRSGVIVKIILSNSIYGIGESYQSAYLPEVSESFYLFIRDSLINKKTEDVDMILKLINIPFASNSGFIRSLISAIEIAICDANAKFYNLPLYKFLNSNAKNKSINLYASGGSSIFNPDQIKKDALKIKNCGFKFYKMRLGYYPWKIDKKRILTAYSIFKDKNLMLDAIMGTLNKWNFEDFKKKINFFNSLKLKWIEEPLHPDQIIEYSKLKKISKNDIAIGESFTNCYEFFNALKLKSADIFQPDVTQLGFRTLLNIHEVLNKFKKKTVLHIWGSNISLLANLHCAIAAYKINLIEYPMVQLKLLQNDLKDIVIINKGIISLNDNVKGLGLSLDKYKLKKYKFIKKSGFKI
jgi:L-alanine-DL-glutamate epimerase-like enolase superfamily enzyme